MTAEEEQPDYKMSLDDVIKKRLKEDKTGRFRPLLNKRRRRFNKRRYDDSKPKVDNRRRIRVENLNKDMQNPDLVKLFEKYGKLTRCGIKFDKLGVSKGIADVEFSTHEECEKAINILDNADISGEKIRVKYAANSFRKFSRRGKSAGTQRRNLRKINRTIRRGVRSRNRRSGTRGTRLSASGRRSYRPKRRYFARTLGRRRQEKKQD
jgi:RNA recognition motif-containing protein